MIAYIHICTCATVLVDLRGVDRAGQGAVKNFTAPWCKFYVLKHTRTRVLGRLQSCTIRRLQRALPDLPAKYSVVACSKQTEFVEVALTVDR